MLAGDDTCVDVMCKTLAAAILLLLTFAAPAHTDAIMRITSESWSAADERGYGEFITAIGESNCRTVAQCIAHPSNPFRASDPPGFYFNADCADLPYFLRFYYAWKRGLPFSYVRDVSPRGRSRDIRYSPRGNQVEARRDVLTGDNALRLLNNLRDQISSATYRIHPELGGDDLYSPALDPRSIRPGTVIYDPNGHLAVIWRIERDGRIRYIDAHPDNSLTRGTYDLRFVRASPGMGAGFKNWRPARLVGASRAPDGALEGGRIMLASNAQIPDFALTQFFGTEYLKMSPRPADSQWRNGTFVLGDAVMDYYDFVRASLPPNIYGTEGDWETYSTPSRDARLKTAFKEVRDYAERFLTLWRTRDARLVYNGCDLAGDMLAAHDRAAASCAISYRRSDGSQVRFGYEEARRRLFRLSFDPYHCVERRWGAEGATCRDGPLKRRWYEAQQRLRNQLDRSYEARMDFALGDLEEGRGGVSSPPDTDTAAFLRTRR